MATSKKAGPASAQSAPRKTATTPTVVKKAIAKTKVPKALNTVKLATATVQKMPNAIFNIDEINELLKSVNQSNVNELKLEKGDFKITIRQGLPVTAAPQTLHPAHSASTAVMTHAAPFAATIASIATPPTADTSTDNLMTIKSPMIGTFYRSSGPGKPNFVNVGDDIKVGQVICIVEAMKLFNEIESEVAGKVVKALADDSSPVEYDQPLFLVEP